MRRSRNPENSHVMKGEITETQNEYDNLIKGLGRDFEKERAKLDEAIEFIEMSNKDEDYKQKARKKYEYAVEMLKEKYDRDVKKVEEELEQQMLEQVEEMDEHIQENEKNIEAMREVKNEASETDMSEVVEMTEQDTKEWENLKTATLEKRKLLKEQADIQERNVRVRRLSGRS